MCSTEKCVFSKDFSNFDVNEFWNLKKKDYGQYGYVFEVRNIIYLYFKCCKSMLTETVDINMSVGFNLENSSFFCSYIGTL